MLVLFRSKEVQFERTISAKCHVCSMPSAARFLSGIRSKASPVEKAISTRGDVYLGAHFPVEKAISTRGDVYLGAHFLALFSNLLLPAGTASEPRSGCHTALLSVLGARSAV